MLRYYRDVWITAWLESKARIRGGMREVIQFIIQTGVFLAILFFLPVLGQVQDEARLVLAGLGGLLASAFLMFLIELVKAPASMAETDRKEVVRLSGVLGFLDDLKAISDEGYGILERWDAARDAHKPNNSLIAQIEHEAQAYIKRHFTGSDLLSYRYGNILLEKPAPKGSPEYYDQAYRRFIDRLTYGQLISENKAYHFKARTLDEERD